MNPRPSERNLLDVSVSAYSILLALYPSDFRRDFGQHMVQVFRDVCRDAYRQGGSPGLMMWWLTTLFDLLKTVISEHRKAGVTMSQARFIQWSGWFCLLGGIFFAASSISQLQPGSQTYQLSIAALVPGMVLITLGLLGMFLRYNAHINLFGKLALLAALGGAAVALIGWVLLLAGGDSFWNVFLVGWLLYLAGHSVFGGFAATIHLLPKWNFALLIGSAMPLTIAVLGLSRQDASTGVSWGAFVMLLLIGVGWILTGWALNSKPGALVQSVASA